MPSGSNEYWQLGQSGNPNGRPLGSRNKRTAEIIAEIRKLGHKDCLMRSSEIVDSSQDAALAISAANVLAPYVHSKRGTTPAPRFVEESIDVLDFASVEQAEDFLASISKRAGAGELELQCALDISTLVKNWILAKQASVELELKVAAHGGAGDQHIFTRQRAFCWYLLIKITLAAPASIFTGVRHRA